MKGEGRLAVVLLAAGAGVRLATGTPKALARLAGRPLVRRAADALVSAVAVDQIVLVTPPGPAGRTVAEALESIVPHPVVVQGGRRRRDSVLAGLLAVEDVRWVVVHDSARALVTAAVVQRVVEAGRRSGAAVAALPATDTLVRAVGGVVKEEVDRNRVHAVQTPQMFERDLLLAAHRAAEPEWDAPDDGLMVRRLGRTVTVVEGAWDNIKITWPEDLVRAEALLAARGSAP